MSNTWRDAYPLDIHIADEPAMEYDRILNDLSEAKSEDGGPGIHKYCRNFRLEKGRPLLLKLDELWKKLTPQERQEREEWRP